MRVLLDTSVLIGELPPPDDVEAAISVASITELHFGVLVADDDDERARRTARLSVVEATFDPLPISVEDVRELLAPEAGTTDVTEKRMFGGLAFLLGGNMAVVVRGKGGVMVRLDPEDHEALLSEPGTDFDVMLIQQVIPYRRFIHSVGDGHYRKLRQAGLAGYKSLQADLVEPGAE